MTGRTRRGLKPTLPSRTEGGRKEAQVGEGELSPDRRTHGDDLHSVTSRSPSGPTSYDVLR